MSDGATPPHPPSQRDPRRFRVELAYSHHGDPTIRVDHFNVLELHVDFQLTMVSLLLATGEKRYIRFEQFNIYEIRQVWDE